MSAEAQTRTGQAQPGAAASPGSRPDGADLAVRVGPGPLCGSGRRPQEPITAVVPLAGLSIFLSTRTAVGLSHDIEFDRLLLLVEAAVAGLLVAVQNFWVSAAPSSISEGVPPTAQPRHPRLPATSPALRTDALVLALLFVWRILLAMFGADTFRSGGSDHGPAEFVLRTSMFGLLVWTPVLAYLGVRALNGWTWARSLAGVAVGVAVFMLFALLSSFFSAVSVEWLYETHSTSVDNERGIATGWLEGASCLRVAASRHSTSAGGGATTGARLPCVGPSLRGRDRRDRVFCRTSRCGTTRGCGSVTTAS